MKYASLLTLIFHCLNASVKYESYKYPSYEIGNTLIYSQIKDDGEEQAESTITKKLLSFDSKSGIPIQKWEEIETQTSPNVESERSWVWYDQRGFEVFLDHLDSDDTGVVEVVSTIQGIVSSSPAIGDTVLNHTQYGSLTINNGAELLSGWGNLTSTGVLSEVSSIQTNLGNIACFKISFNTDVNIKLYAKSKNYLEQTTKVTGFKWYSNKYGLVKETHTNNTIIVPNEGDEINYTENVTSTLISASVNNSSTHSIKIISNSPNQQSLDGWNWHSWPWVYQETSKNWLYYYPTAEGVYAVFSNNEKTWYTWDSESMTWDLFK